MQSEHSPAAVEAVLIEDHMELTLDDVTGACAVEMGRIVALVEEGVLDPVGTGPGQWRFSGAQLRRAATALRLQNDLEVNLAGVALALELLDEIGRLRLKLQALGS
jgi:chaperone modulatory protein CbpM